MKAVRDFLACFIAIAAMLIGAWMFRWGRRGVALYNVPYNGDGYVFCLTVESLGVALVLGSALGLALLLRKVITRQLDI